MGKNINTTEVREVLVSGGRTGAERRRTVCDIVATGDGPGISML